MSDLWTWAVETYARPGVKDAVLALQNDRGVDAVLLLWRIWLWEGGRTAAPAAEAQAIAMSEAWRRDVVAKLRTARDALKSPAGGIESTGANALRRAVLDAELAAEKLQLEALERLAANDPAADRPCAKLLDFLADFAPLRNVPHAEFSTLLAALGSR